MVVFARFLFGFVVAFFKSKSSAAMKIALLEHQTRVYQRKRGRKRLPIRDADRALWALVSRIWSGWRQVLYIARPETVIRWHRKGYTWWWRLKSRKRKPGRPPIPQEHIELIRRISSENPSWGEKKIADELEKKLGIKLSTATIRKYRVPPPEPGQGQTWGTFVHNHATEIFACDFMTQITLFFTTVYIFVVMEISSRRIVHFNVTTEPTLIWVKQQIREATAYGQQPRFFIHDNDQIFGQYGRPKLLFSRRRNCWRIYRCHLDYWLDNVMHIDGIPIPYGAPNASPHIERHHRAMREEGLDFFIFLGVAHVYRVCKEYIEYYNRARVSQAINAIPDPYPELLGPPPTEGKIIALPVLGGIHHDYRRAA